MKHQLRLSPLIETPPRKSYLTPFEKWLLLAAMLLLLSACGTPQFLVDPKGSTSPENYFADLNECQQIVDRRHNTTWEVAKGSFMGGAIGGGLAYGAVKLGHVNQPVGYAVGAGALAGAILSGFTSGLGASSNNEFFVKKCLEGRGHVILE